MKKIKFLLGISVLVLVVYITSFGVMAADKPPVVIGLQGPITGPYAIEGEMAKQCVETAAALINEKGGILGGRMIEIMVVDDAMKPKESALAAIKLISKAVPAVIQTYGSSITKPASDIYERYKKVNIAYGATDTVLTEEGLEYFLRTCGRTDTQGNFFAEYVVNVFGAKRIAIMHDNQSFSVGLAKNTKKALQPKIDAGEVEIVYYDAITPGESDFTVPLTKLRETNPDIFYFTGYFPEAGLIIRQARNIGITCPFVGGDAALNDEFIKIAGLEMAKGCLMTQEALLKDIRYPEAVEFKEAYNAKYGYIPSSPWAVYAADALNVIAYAIDQTGSTDSDVLVDYLKNKLENFPGITGSISFDEKGDRIGTGISLYVVTDEGGFEIYNP